MGNKLSFQTAKDMVLLALGEYRTGNAMSITRADAVKFAEYMSKQISGEEMSYRCEH